MSLTIVDNNFLAFSKSLYKSSFFHLEFTFIYVHLTNTNQKTNKSRAVNNQYKSEKKRADEKKKHNHNHFYSSEHNRITSIRVTCN
jgi:hypothetical protein